MTSWLSLIPPVAATLGILAVLGLPSALALRLRGFAIALVAVPAAFAVLAVSAVLAGAAGIPWGPLPPVAVAIAVAVVLRLLRRWIGVPDPRSGKRAVQTRRFWLPVGSAAIGGAAIAVALVMSLKTADAVSQTYDAVFHLNAVRQVLDSGSASPFDLDLAAPGRAVFYPALWHGLVALIVQLTGASIPLATNAALFTACAVVWPLGALALGRAVAGPGRTATVVSGVLVAAFPGFPLTLAGFGVLYPNLLSTTLLPYVFVAVLQLLNLGPARRADPLPAGTRWLLLLGGFGAAALAHPNALHVALLWTAFPVLIAAVRTMRGAPALEESGALGPARGSLPLRRIAAALGLVLFGALTLVAWYIGRTSDNPWEGRRGPLGALVDVVGATPHLEGHSWPVALLVLAGAVIAWRRPRLRWTLGSAAVLALAFVVAYGFPGSAWRTLLLSPWYNDPWRLAALVGLGALPLAVLGGTAVAACWRIGRRRLLAASAAAHRTRTDVLTTAFGVALLLAMTQGAGAHAGVQYVSSKYTASEKSQLLSPDERTLLERLPEHVPEGETLATNPWNGGSLAYAIAGYEVLVPHTAGTYDPRYMELTSSLGEGSDRACALAEELDVNFVLDFGTRYVFSGTPRAEPFSGISGLDDPEALTEVDREGDAVLYEVTGCD